MLDVARFDFVVVVWIDSSKIDGGLLDVIAIVPEAYNKVILNYFTTLFLTLFLPTGENGL